MKNDLDYKCSYKVVEYICTKYKEMELENKVKIVEKKDNWSGWCSEMDKTFGMVGTIKKIEDRFIIKYVCVKFDLINEYGNPYVFWYPYECLELVNKNIEKYFSIFDNTWK